MATTFYIKKQNDIDIDGNYLFNSANSLSIDANFRNISLGKLSRKHELKKLIGNGQKIIRSTFRNPQTIKGSIKFDSNSNNTFDEQRRNFLVTWVYTEDTRFLFRNENDRLTMREVVVDIDGNENYDFYPISNDINFILLSEKPFFDNVIEDTETFIKTSSTEEVVIVNEGEYTPFIVNFTFGSGASQFIIKLFENKAVQINYSFSNTMVLKVDMADLTIFINDIERTNLNVVGSPFSLVPGSNTIKIISAAPGAGDITYNERYT